jgi:hypothetical protein
MAQRQKAANKSGKKINLPEHSNCEVTKYEGNHLEFDFAGKKGMMAPARWNFDSKEEIVDYLADLFQLDRNGQELRGKVTCRGKYDRVAEAKEGHPFTFGDPILDLITDSLGEISIAGRKMNLSRVDLSSPRERSGGIRSIDLGGPMSEDLRLQVARAGMGIGDEIALVECNNELVSVASTNPAQRDFYRSGDHMRFKAWKKNYFFYWSMGAEIETWGHDFSTAQIEGRYLDTVFGNLCATVKVDSDSDRNDDYVDEYEWGVNAPQPLRVVSNCSANWHGSNFAGQVEKGPSCVPV